jgi:hypothetical protein
LNLGDALFIFVRSTIACWLRFVKASRNYRSGALTLYAGQGDDDGD